MSILPSRQGRREKLTKFIPHFATGPQKGSIIIFCVVIIFIFSLVMLGLLGYATMELRLTRSTVNREQAFQIAEAGANYYIWHLAHFPNDFWDGNASTTVGPYVHTYTDSVSGQTLGQYSLKITAPPVGSTIVTVESTGYASLSPQTKRKVTLRYGIPSLAQYAFLTNSDAWIGSLENINGQFFTNGGLRFDGTGNAPIMSAKSTYACGPLFGCSPTTTKAGIWGSAASSTQNFWQFPQPNVDFTTITADLATMKSGAQTAGIYLPPSSAQGYSLVFLANGTVDIYKVTSLSSQGKNGVDINGITHNNAVDYSTRTLLYNTAIPANGLIYVEDNTWVEGTVNGRAMVAAAKLPYNPATAPSIMLGQNSLLYLAKNGQHSLGLIGQKDVLVTYLSQNNLEIDGALIAQNGSVQRYYWNGNTKNSITIYGTIASYGIWTWTWVTGGGSILSGYINTSTVYDGNLLYSPPPSFPLNYAAGYQQISWSSD